MKHKETFYFLRYSWGLDRFLLLAAIGIFFAYTASGARAGFHGFLIHPFIRVILMVSLIGMYITAFLSFSKIFKFKAFLLGHLLLATGLIYYYLNYGAYPHPDAFFTLPFIHKVSYITSLRVLIILMSINLMITAVSPPSMKYRVTRLIALFFLIAEPLAYFFILYNASGPAADSLLLQPTGYLTTVYLTGIAAIILSFRYSREENSFGGMITGLTFINFIIAHNLAGGSIVIAKFLIFLLPVLFTGGLLLYWFSCLHHRVAYDPLLKIYNRDYAHNIINGTSKINLGRPFCIAMIDIDRFKSVNDKYGHQVGDDVLFGTAQCIKRHAMPRGVTCRYGGEEIIVFFRGLNKNDALLTGERIRQKVRKITYDVGKKGLAVSVSIGIAECDDPNIPIDRIVKAADQAVYKAKETGRNKVVLGKIKKRDNNPNRPTYVNIKNTGRDRRDTVNRKK